MMEWEDGKEYPVIRLDISSDSHPFYTGRQKFAAADGRVERFNKSLVLNQTTNITIVKLSTFNYGCIGSFYVYSVYKCDEFDEYLLLCTENINSIVFR